MDEQEVNNLLVRRSACINTGLCLSSLSRLEFLIALINFDILLLLLPLYLFVGGCPMGEWVDRW